MAIQKISNSTITAIENKSAANLPDRPSDYGYSAQRVKRAFIDPITDTTLSVVTEINRIVDEINEAIGSGTLPEGMTNVIDGLGDLKTEIDGLDSGIADRFTLDFDPTTYTLSLVVDKDEESEETIGTVDLPLESLLLGASISGTTLTLTFKVGDDDTQTVTVDMGNMLTTALATKADAAIIGDLDDLTTTDDDTIVGAINEINAALADKADAATVTAALGGKADADTVSAALENKADKSAVGENSALTTTSKTTLVSAINELKSNLDNKAEMDDVTAAISDLLEDDDFKSGLETDVSSILSQYFELSLDPSTYELTLWFKKGEEDEVQLGEAIDLPLENLLLGAAVSNNTLILTFRVGTDEEQTVSIDLTTMLSNAISGKADSADMGSLSNLTTTIKTSIVAAINELVTSIANLDESTDGRLDAIEEVLGSGDLPSGADDVIGSLNALKTEIGTVDEAVDDLKDAVGDVSTLTTTATDLAGAVNELDGDISDINTALAGKQATLTFDNAPTANSDNPVKSGGIKTALDGKQDALTFDNAPTENSTNPVKSGGVYTAIAALTSAIGDIDTILDSINGEVV